MEEDPSQEIGHPDWSFLESTRACGWEGHVFDAGLDVPAVVRKPARVFVLFFVSLVALVLVLLILSAW